MIQLQFNSFQKHLDSLFPHKTNAIIPLFPDWQEYERRKKELGHLRTSDYEQSERSY
jgi:hypothetical protein